VVDSFSVTVEIASPTRRERGQPVELLVDSRSPYTSISAATLRALGIETTERGAAEVLITLEGRTLHTLVLFGDPGDLEVLGAYTLEGFALAIDPVQRRLIPAIVYGALAYAG
jgi:hypothetical protein